MIYAVEKGNVEIIELLVNNPKIEINQKVIHFYNLEFIFIISNSNLLFEIHFHNLIFIFIIYN